MNQLHNKYYQMENKYFLRFVIVLIFLSVLSGCRKKAELEIIETRCQCLVNPVGIDDSGPVFSWIAKSPERQQFQSAYRILVSDDEVSINNDNGKLWDSGMIDSGETFAVSYNGKPLLSNRTYYWKVKIWDGEGRPTDFSKTAKFTTAVIDTGLWVAPWIGAGIDKDPINKMGFYDEKIEVDKAGDTVKYDGVSLLLRKEHKFKKPIAGIIAHICGLGLYEFYINGKRVGNKVLNPAKTNYNEVVLYDTYDITELVNEGDNAFGIILGNGWFNPLPKWWSWRMQWFGEKRAMLQMHIRYKDGFQEIITTDESWKINDGPVRSHCIYDGENYDATEEADGWNEPGFDDADWRDAEIVNPPEGKLKNQLMPAISRNDTLQPLIMSNSGDTLTLVDFGQNFAGWAKIGLKADKGKRIVIRYAENAESGRLDTKTNLRAAATDTYIAKGNGKEIYEPRFTYHGFRFVKIKGTGNRIRADDINGIVVHSSVKPAGTFLCSNEQINEIQKAIIWSQRSNLMGYPTDCPQREERLGWIGDAHVTAEEAIFNFDMNRFYIKWLNDIRVNQDDSSGYIPYIAPRPISKGDPAFSWSSGYHLITWYHYLYYGDKQVLETHYESMKKYVDYLSSLSDGYILPNDKYGDWASPAEEWERGQPESTSTAYYYYLTTILAKVSCVLGNDKNAQTYEMLADSIKNAFNQRYYDPEEKKYDDGSQFANSFALFLGLVPEDERDAVMAGLVDDIVNKHDCHLTTGILGTKYLMETLSNEGRSDIAWELATQTSFPSWTDMIEGLTTLPEHWNQGGSHNHVMFGSIGSWFYKVLGGIRVHEDGPGFKKIIIKPYVPEDLSWVKSSIVSVNGRIKSEWEKDAENYRLNIKVPFNTEATVFVLAKDADEVTEGGKPAKKRKDISFHLLILSKI